MADLDPRDPLEQLRAANPFSNHTTPQPERAPDALFKEITMTTAPNSIATFEDPGRGDSPPDPALPALNSRRRWRPSIALPAAAAVGGLVVAGAVVFGNGDSPSAYAFVNDAATNSAVFDSGRAVVVIDLDQVPGETTSGRMTFDFRYDDGDFAFVADQSGLSLDTGSSIEMRGVGDQLYSSFEDGSSFVVSDRSSGTESVEALFGFQPNALQPSTVVGLVKRAEDFAKVTSEGGGTTFQGSVTLADITAIGPASLPAGLSLLADGDADQQDLPETIGIEVTVDDGLLSMITIEIDGETPIGYARASIVSTFSEYGDPQSIIAPTADQITDDPFAVLGDDLPPGFAEALAVLDEVDARRPGLCSEVFDGSTPDVSEADIVSSIDAFPACLEAAGEQAAAEAFRSLSSVLDS